MKKCLFLLLVLNIAPYWCPQTATFSFSQTVQAQNDLRVLFLGNSYTSYNNLPQMVKDFSTGAGKNLIIDSNMPGGMLISGHLSDPISQQKIMQGNWDYIVIQEQSQVPTIDYYRYNDMYPSLTDLKQIIEQYNPCAKIITYMTWGRRFGGQQCDPPATYCSPAFVDFNHMQDTLTSAYLEISYQLKIQCAPVGVIWQNILNDTTLVLHAADNSHPNLEGSYAAACALFSSIWKIPAASSTYTAGLSAALTAYYRQMSDQTIFGNPVNWNLYINNPTAGFTPSANGAIVNFTNTSVSETGANLTYSWEFGDGDTSSIVNPQHTYSASGNYQVKLIARDCIFSDTLVQNIQIGALGETEFTRQLSMFQFLPNPSAEQIEIRFSGTQKGELSVYHLSGQIIEAHEISPGTNRVEINHLPAGTYFLRLKSGEITETQKLFVIR